MMLRFVVVLLICVSISTASQSGLSRFFHERLDRNNDGVVTSNEVVRMLREMDDDMKLEPAAIAKLMSRIDTDKSQDWSWSEFQSAHLSLDRSSVSVSGSDPHQIHLALDTDRSNMIVVWVTGDPTDSVVQVGLSDGQYTQSVTGSRHTYTAGDWKGWIHKVTLTGLVRGNRYHYRVGDGSNWSADYNFRTESPTPQPGIIATYGDMGTTIPEGFLVARQIAEDHQKYHFDAVLHNGDLAYASTAVTLEDGDVGGEWEWVWDLFCDQVQPFAAYTPYMTGVGNHERFYNFSSYLNRFSMPAPWGGEGDTAKFWFSFDLGLAHYAMMSTEHPYNIGSEQYEWLKNDLAVAVANRAQRPWIFVTGHRPMYCSDPAEWDSHKPGAAFQVEIEPLFQQYKVDMYLCGHMHIYERIHPVWNGVTQYNNTDPTHQVYVNPVGTTHAVQGNAGVFTDHTWMKPLPDWSAFRSSDFGYGRITLFNATHLHYEFDHTDTRELVDDFYIVKTA
eukprot:TRINITY_DN14556_c0_g1_i1.p1 TRINITY_DN14556_c0_g1~~TRINITY_DN14556_c0_g1_i1.p1  ORF type:complete len:503 (-),score=73.79 TRINITY_DN14556_c0_g1_i1:44-1552(-)